MRILGSTQSPAVLPSQPDSSGRYCLLSSLCVREGEEVGEGERGREREYCDNGTQAPAPVIMNWLKSQYTVPCFAAVPAGCQVECTVYFPVYVCLSVSVFLSESVSIYMCLSVCVCVLWRVSVALFM